MDLKKTISTMTVLPTILHEKNKKNSCYAKVTILILNRNIKPMSPRDMNQEAMILDLTGIIQHNPCKLALTQNSCDLSLRFDLKI